MQLAAQRSIDKKFKKSLHLVSAIP